jgi:putative SOS response-associated peptidase YedK
MPSSSKALMDATKKRAVTTEPNAEVGAIHPKAMPVILTAPEEIETLDDSTSGRGPEAAATSTG